MIYLILDIAILLIGIIITNNVFESKLPDFLKNLFQNIVDFVKPHANLIGWIAFIFGLVTLFTRPASLLFSLISALLGVYILNDELMKIPSLGELLHNLSDGLSKYKEVLAIIGIVFGILGLLNIYF